MESPRRCKNSRDNPLHADLYNGHRRKNSATDRKNQPRSARLVAFFIRTRMFWNEPRSNPRNYWIS
jgi:hypothetical protein